MALFLKELNETDSEKEYLFFQNMQNENGFEVRYNGISYDSFVNNVIPERINASKSKRKLCSGHILFLMGRR